MSRALTAAALAGLAVTAAATTAAADALSFKLLKPVELKK